MVIDLVFQARIAGLIDAGKVLQIQRVAIRENHPAPVDQGAALGIGHLGVIDPDHLGPLRNQQILAGNGIINIFEFLQLKKNGIPAWLTTQLRNEDAAKVISSNAKKVEICGQTMQLFFRYLAQEAAQLALKTKATGGLFIGGGIMPQILSLLDVDAFIQQFTDFGRRIHKVL